MLFVNPNLTNEIIKCLVLAKLGEFDRALDTIDSISRVDPLSAFITFLLIGYQQNYNIRIVSPWIEDIEIYLPPSIARYLGTSEHLKLSDILNSINKNATIEIITRTSRKDLYRDTTIGRGTLISNINTEKTIIKYIDTIHTKCIEINNRTLILTANIVEKELYKLRTYENILSITKRPCLT